MLTAILFTVLPTLLLYILLPKIGIQIKSKFFLVAFTWFSGLYLFTICTFLVAVFFSLFTTSVLLKALYTMLFIVELSLLFFVRDIGKYILSFRHFHRFFQVKQVSNLIIILFCIFFSVIFFLPHLAFHNGTIYTSPVYWDFHWHAALIQNFVYGDNFPPQNEAFSGVPQTYHYFWGIVAGMYEAGGLTLVDAINTISILSFAFFLISIIGLSEELFQAKYIGVIAVILTLTSSSLHALFYFMTLTSQSFLKTITDILTSTAQPFTASFLPGTTFNYYGTIFNLFYFLEERQLIFGVIYLILCIWIITKREQFSSLILFLLGCFMGAFFLWHLYVAIMIGCALVVVFLIGAHRKKTAFLFAGFSLIFGVHIIYFKEVIHTKWFMQTIETFPKFNFSYTSSSDQPLTAQQFIYYYFFAYGAKLVAVLLGLLYLLWKKRNIFVTFIAILVPTFLLINMVQFSPASISENHKWVRPLDVMIDITSAVILYKVFFAKKQFLLIILGIIIMFSLTISGFIELMPFLNSKPTTVYAMYPSAMTQAIWSNTSPHASFIGDDTTEIQLAGRKLFVGDVLGGDIGLKVDERKSVITQLYNSPSIKDFCPIATSNGIDYMEFTPQNYSPLLGQLTKFPHFETTNMNGEQVLFVTVDKLCNNIH